MHRKFYFGKANSEWFALVTFLVYITQWGWVLVAASPRLLFQYILDLRCVISSLTRALILSETVTICTIIYRNTSLNNGRLIIIIIINFIALIFGKKNICLSFGHRRRGTSVFPTHRPTHFGLSCQSWRFAHLFLHWVINQNFKKHLSESQNNLLEMWQRLFNMIKDLM